MTAFIQAGLLKSLQATCFALLLLVSMLGCDDLFGSAAETGTAAVQPDFAMRTVDGIPCPTGLALVDRISYEPSRLFADIQEANAVYSRTSDGGVPLVVLDGEYNGLGIEIGLDKFRYKVGPTHPVRPGGWNNSTIREIFAQSYYVHREAWQESGSVGEQFCHIPCGSNAPGAEEDGTTFQPAALSRVRLFAADPPNMLDALKYDTVNPDDHFIDHSIWYDGEARTFTMCDDAVEFEYDNFEPPCRLHDPTKPGAICGDTCVQFFDVDIPVACQERILTTAMVFVIENLPPETVPGVSILSSFVRANIVYDYTPTSDE